MAASMDESLLDDVLACEKLWPGDRAELDNWIENFISKDGPYNHFAGKDASRALALMSFDANDVENTDISDLDEMNVKFLMD